jgi:hypothetical protein
MQGALMQIHFRKVLLAVFITVSQVGTAIHSANALAAFGSGELIRWTGTEDSDGTFTHALSKLGQKIGKSLNEKDFLLEEDRDLAFNHYKRWVQLIDQVPVHGNFIRIWTQLNSNQLIQFESNIEIPTRRSRNFSGPGFLPFDTRPDQQSAHQLRQALTSHETMALARQVVENYQDDPFLRGVNWKDEWNQGQLIRLVKIKGKRGYHQIRIGLKSKQVIFHRYSEFPQADISIPVQVYPIYEEVENGDGIILPRVPAELKHILSQVPHVEGDIYAPIQEFGKLHPYYDLKFDPILGETEEGRAEGYWSFNHLKSQAASLRSQLSLVDNSWKNGILLEGRYATINIHPEAMDKFKPLNFTLVHSSALFFDWAETTFEGRPTEVMTPETAYSGQRLFSPQEAWNRRAQRLPNHDPAQYINDGFDEIQVYYAIDTLFEALHTRGFSDPELATRPFNAFLFNPDIAYRDNAFYTDDTINFTTYSPKAGNAARDNVTIWHELGHGIMDRLMGTSIELADTGGLSEGMADFVAALVVQAVTQGVPFPGSDQFRILNQTGFYLTNEVHDDGEAYGGAMKDFLDAVIQTQGAEVGLNQVADLVLEAMRLTRDFPGLTAPEWFKHLVFADSLGRPGLRLPGELSPFLLKSLASRNFRLDGGQVAKFSLVNVTSPGSRPGDEIEAENPGTREHPIRLNLGKTETAQFKLQASLKSSKDFQFHYPAEIRVHYHGSALQGAIHWVDKEQGPKSYILNQESDKVTLPLSVTGTCDEINRTDGSCVDYADILVFDRVGNGNSTNTALQKPVAKKRFYLRILTR